jgi:hypothetical protein
MKVWAGLNWHKGRYHQMMEKLGHCNVPSRSIKWGGGGVVFFE